MQTLRNRSDRVLVSNKEAKELEGYTSTQVSQLEPGDKVRGADDFDLEVLAITMRPERSGYTVLTLFDRFSKQHVSQVYKNRDRMLKKDKKPAYNIGG